MGHGMLQDHALVPIHALDRALDHALVQELLQALGQRQVQEVLGHAPGDGFKNTVSFIIC